MTRVIPGQTGFPRVARLTPEVPHKKNCRSRVTRMCILSSQHKTCFETILRRCFRQNKIIWPCPAHHHVCTFLKRFSDSMKTQLHNEKHRLSWTPSISIVTFFSCDCGFLRKWFPAQTNKKYDYWNSAFHIVFF
jgi:hypothetical protein